MVDRRDGVPEHRRAVEVKNAKEWWDTSTAFSALVVKVGLGAMLFRTKLKAARPK